MPKHGSRRSRPRPSAEPRAGSRPAAGLVLATLLLSGAAGAEEGGLRPFTVVGDAIPGSLTGAAGDPAEGRAITVGRQRGLCLLCHSGPFPQERFQGTLGPDLAGVGARLSEGQIRLRLVDGRRLDPDTIMPSYYRIEGLNRVGSAWRGKPILTAEEIEDVVAFLATLRD
jgi:sulfur-oxidizing protein SoxX